MARTQLGTALGISLWLAAQSCLAAIVPPLPQPTWKELSPEQQRILAPLAGEWDRMEGFRRKKWMGIAQRYQSMSPDEQSRMQRRMTSWAKLTPEERKRARDKYLKLQNAPPEKKQDLKKKWEQYKDLPEAEKARLAAEAARKNTRRPAQTKSQPRNEPGSEQEKPSVKRVPPKAVLPPQPTAR